MAFRLGLSQWVVDRIEITDVEPGDWITRGLFASPRPLLVTKVGTVREAGDWWAVLILADGRTIHGRIGEKVFLWRKEK